MRRAVHSGNRSSSILTNLARAKYLRSWLKKNKRANKVSRTRLGRLRDHSELHYVLMLCVRGKRPKDRYISA